MYCKLQWPPVHRKYLVVTMMQVSRFKAAMAVSKTQNVLSMETPHMKAESSKQQLYNQKNLYKCTLVGIVPIS